jgi:O-antigen ligase
MWKAIDYSGSRSGIIGVFVFGAIFIIMNARDPLRRTQAAIGVLVAAIGVAFFIKVLLPLLELRKGSAVLRLSSGSRGSDSARDIINEEATEQVWDSPIFGVGYQVLRVAHNIYLQILHAAGLVGFIGYLMVSLLPLYFLRRPMEGVPARIVSVSLFAATAGILILSWVKSNPSEFTTGIFFALVVYWGVAMSSRDLIFSPVRRR